MTLLVVIKEDKKCIKYWLTRLSFYKTCRFPVWIVSLWSCLTNNFPKCSVIGQTSLFSIHASAKSRKIRVNGKMCKMYETG